MAPDDETVDRPIRTVNPHAKKTMIKRSLGSMRDEASPVTAVHEALTLFFLWIAQLVSILGCLLSVFVPILSLYKLNRTGQIDDFDPIVFAMIVGSSVIGFIYSYAMAVVFSRTRTSQEYTTTHKAKRIF
jgi:multisubunit Na+/H+ antiporter MnhC subunit